MRYDFAPLEGITDATFRSLHHRHFSGVDRYYMPFISPTIHRCLTHREARELPSADSVDFVAIPQLLGKSVEDMLWAVDTCRDLGYGEVNINLGCPSGTVFSKGKGSGMLADPDGLDRFLDSIYARASLPVSLKTRIGVEHPEEFAPILEIYNRYPVAELTVHPRVRKAFYKGPCHMDVFDMAYQNSRAPLCYNGSINTLAEARAMEARYPALRSIMIGRGLVADPGMLCGGTDRQRLSAYLDDMAGQYAAVFESKRNAVFRLKENWHYLIALFDGCDRHWKILRKTTDFDTFRAVSNEIIQTLPMRATPAADW